MLRWGILGTGKIADKFATAAGLSAHNALVAVASRSRAGADAFVRRYPGVIGYADYAALLADPGIDAVYVATPHPQHAEWTIRALSAGKHVLCEKPLGMNHPEVMAMLHAARRHDRFLMEAFMYRCHPQTATLVRLLAEGAIGEVRHVRASFGYHAPFDPGSRLFANAQGGGGILDVGCYPVSAARLIAGSEPIAVHANGHLGTTGVDEWSAAALHFDGGLTAHVATGVSLALDNALEIYGSLGHIRLANPWLCADAAGNWGFDLVRRGREPERVSGNAPPLYVTEIDHVAARIDAGARESDLVSWQDSRGNAIALDAWRAAIGLEYRAERPESHRGPLLGHIRLPERPVAQGRIRHLDKPVSRLVMGCDNQPGMSHAAVMWDDYVERGGNCFDTAHIYGGGSMERLLGHWQRSRNVRESIVIVGKGAHTPDCFPDKIAPQLDETLERLQTDYVDVYFLHRDNAEVPVGEFVDALGAEAARGRIRAFGGSNWTLARIREANAHAQRNGLQPFTAVSNNFALAHMVTPIWPGVETATGREFRDYLVAAGIALLPWSAQARGFFTPWAARVIAEQETSRGRALTRVEPTADELRRTWFSPGNLERRRRAVALAEQRGVEVIQIALAYVIRQPFACFPLIGARTLDETQSCFDALEIELDPAELEWLDLGDR